MIDISSKVFDTVYTAVTTVDSTVDVMDVPPELLAKYPSVVVREVGNVPVKSTNTDDCAENYTRISYEINVYTDNKSGAREKATQIFQAFDTAMQNLKFARTMTRRLPNQDRTIYRMYGRYEVIVSAPETVGNNTVYHMYRR